MTKESNTPNRGRRPKGVVTEQSERTNRELPGHNNRPREITELRIVYLPAESLRPSPYQAHTHNQKHLAQIEASIRAFGHVVPILIRPDLTIINGHAILEAAVSLGMSDVPTICLNEHDDAELRALALSLNRLAEKGGWDEQVLKAEFEFLAIQNFAFELEISGFETLEIDNILDCEVLRQEDTDDDVMPVDENVQPVAQEGDVFRLGKHILVCGDAREQRAYLAALGDAKADLIFTDPPYNVKIQGNVAGSGKNTYREFAMASGEMSPTEFTEFLRCVFCLLCSHCRDGSIHFIAMDWRHMQEILSAGLGAYTELKNVCVWNKSNAGMGTFYRSKHELFFVFKNGSAKHVNNFGLGETGRYRTNVWEYPSPSALGPDRSAQLEMHPTVKPVSLVADAIRDCSKRGDLILDPFCGSGTTIIAAAKTGRHARCIELDPLYVDTAIRRWQKWSEKEAVHIGSGRTFDEIEANGRTVVKPRARARQRRREVKHG